MFKEVDLQYEPKKKRVYTQIHFNSSFKATIMHANQRHSYIFVATFTAHFIFNNKNKSHYSTTNCSKANREANKGLVNFKPQEAKTQNSKPQIQVLYIKVLKE